METSLEETFVDDGGGDFAASHAFARGRHRLRDILPSGVRETHVEDGPVVVPGGARHAGGGASHPGREGVEFAQDLDANASGSDGVALGEFVEAPLREVHQGGDLRLGALEVVGAEGVDAQAAHPEREAPLEHVE